MKTSKKDATAMNDTELAAEIAKVEKHLDKIKKSPIMEHPEAFTDLWKEWKKEKKIGKKERVLYL